MNSDDYHQRGKDKRQGNQNYSLSVISYQLSQLSDAILQAARIKFTKTEYISCPGCGRTLYNLQDTIRRIKAATSHLVGLKIGIMGCIVNGPGEMADADYGYVGAGRGKISLYRQKECVAKNIPEEEAVDRLLQLIEADGH
jgi:(E)-4-hydroxy-3-methylbut-2-enyl-diphosphate synthase